MVEIKRMMLRNSLISVLFKVLNEIPRCFLEKNENLAYRDRIVGEIQSLGAVGVSNLAVVEE